MEDVIAALGAMEVSHVLIEGGGEILTEALRKKLVNEVAFFIAPAVMGTATRALGRLPTAVWLREVSYRMVEADLFCRGMVG